MLKSLIVDFMKHYYNPASNIFILQKLKMIFTQAITLIRLNSKPSIAETKIEIG